MTVLDDFGAAPFRAGNIESVGFPLTDDQRSWARRATTIGGDVLEPAAKTTDSGVYPNAALRELWSAGILNMTVPKESGGGGADLLAQVVVTETLARHCASTALCFHMHESAMQLLSRVDPGDAGLAATVRSIVEDFRLCTYATSEAGSGSHWWHMDQAANRVPDGFHLKATKSWATSAGHADYYVVPLRANQHAGHNELTLFLVRGNTSGVEPIGTWDGSGMRGNSSTPVRFDVVVPPSARLGASGYGFPLLFAYGLPAFQLGVASVYLGVAQAAYDETATRMGTRVHTDLGRPKSHSEVVQREVAEMRLRLDATRALLYVVADNVSRRQRDGADLVDLLGESDLVLSLAQTKIAATETALAITDTALRLCGGSAYKRGGVVERCFRDARAGTVMGPDNDSLKDLIGKRTLGIPFPWATT
ncbi:acyl-CoA dehydrogenase family protein [Actinophytocola oryzae]|uniref:Dibenzothiophene monooxygenase n=1 Tax=Actinophytocola oryzae TaxID=502181 RepID=A0A4R7W0Y3_9PSEU|nr:acyl-CoA dehydrogenase family protein [Actinophytocola oryzae]TDV56190.1 alkylation response protein AidB-like acyl-CoA dehydrogenase [Actinophytocola oryzae]